MPTYDELFFMVEKVAMEVDWPEEKWPLLVQSVFTWKAKRAMAALDSVGLEYDATKAVLVACGSVLSTYTVATLCDLR